MKNFDKSSKILLEVRRWVMDVFLKIYFPYLNTLHPTSITSQFPTFQKSCSKVYIVLKSFVILVS
ncbi:hypothetical protein BHF72_0368 [Cloacibacterium normanense]|uniref:Uncharacterized protein n=1 Tax=Cloacibacterium normanense TaxID=237258 RepID=A0A1E5UD02_9FLAO|nr:hypothetical protein BHF72_0368 [Cloacibacterium normanense]